MATYTSVQNRLSRQSRTDPPSSGLSSQPHTQPASSGLDSRAVSSCYSDSNPQLKDSESSCLCFRPMKLILCGSCGKTFPGRLRVHCPAHPEALNLQDESVCWGCKPSDLTQLMEFELPAGMEERIKWRSGEASDLDPKYDYDHVPSQRDKTSRTVEGKILYFRCAKIKFNSEL